MLQILLVLTVMCVSEILTFEQNGFLMNFERAELIRYNHDYASDAKIVTFKYNRTVAVVNATYNLKHDIASSLKLKVKAYKFASNEYRDFPLQFSFNLCEAINRDDFGLKRLFACGNVTTCPFKKGRSVVCNFSPNVEKYPPFIPEGSYMLDLKWFDALTEVAFLQGYGTIKNKFPWSN